MRTTILTRSVVALATLAVGSVALAATPANAAAANGVTRDQVITAVNGFRAADANDTGPTAATSRALKAIVYRGCDVLPDENESVAGFEVWPVTTASHADGLMITAEISRDFGNQFCTIAAFATTDPTFQLSGTVAISGARFGVPAPAPTVLLSQTLSGDAFVTTALDTAQINDNTLTASATGNAVKTTKVATSKKVADKKSKSEKKAAKKAYSKSLKSAKKSYAKALDKAGKSKSKKAAAKKAYSKKRTAAKAKYRTAIADFRIVKSTTTVTETPRAFSITTPVPTDSQR